jgi:hypothetical protein
MSQDTGKFRQNDKDQYYTKASVAEKCVATLLTIKPIVSSYEWIEPSAGSGVFLNALPKNTVHYGIDLEPKGPGIVEADFLNWTPPPTSLHRIFFGNPPFGKQGSLAKDFIKRAALTASVIAFILPRSFTKPSMSNAFPPLFHCIHSEDVEPNAFEVNGEEYHVPCVFQIWEKRTESRPIPIPLKEKGFTYIKHGQPFHIAFRRVGVNAGRSFPEGIYSYQSHYFLRLDAAYVSKITSIIEKINRHTFPSNTTGPRSLAKPEVNEVINQILASSS